MSTNLTAAPDYVKQGHWPKVSRFKAALALALALLNVGYATTVIAAENTFAKQDLEALKPNIQDFLVAQSMGNPGKVKVTVGAIDPRLKLAQCMAIEVFLPAGSRAWGKTSVGVRCSAPVNWTIYAQANVSVNAPYLVAAKPLSQGHLMVAEDFFMQEGDLTQLPAGIFTDASQVLGRSVSSSVAAGSVLRQDFIKQALSIQQGQTVMLTTNGIGFTIAAEGKALKNAVEGQLVQVKVESGQTVTGVARADGKVEVSF